MVVLFLIDHVTAYPYILLLACFYTTNWINRRQWWRLARV